MLKKDLNYQEKNWIGKFGNEYTVRNKINKKVIVDCEEMFTKIFQKLKKHNFKKILEVGCNQGRNLIALKNISKAELFAVEPNKLSRESLLKNRIIKEENVKDSLATKLPFSDNIFDLVFTSVVLIHVPENKIKKAIKEIFRVSKNYVLAIEYFSPETNVVKYRGKKNLLFKRDYGSIYMDSFKNIKLIDYGFFWKRVSGQDNVNWWLFKKTKI